MEIIALIAFLIIGILSGFVAGLFGISGGVIAVPSLFLILSLLGFPQSTVMHVAIGTSLASMIVAGTASVISHQKHKGIMWEWTFSMLPGVVLGCMLGTFISHFFLGVFLEIFFGLFICLLGAYLLFYRSKNKEAKKPDKALLTWIGMGIGTLASMLGIGGGIFVVPLLVSYRYPQKKAIGTSSAISLMITIFAVMGYIHFGMQTEEVRPYQLGYVYLPAFGMVSVATAICAPIGAHLAHKLAGKKLQHIFASSLILIGILMIFN